MGKNAQKRRGKKHRGGPASEPSKKTAREPLPRGPKWLERTVFASRADLPAPERHDLFGVALRTSFAIVCGPDFAHVAREVGEALRSERVVILHPDTVIGRYRAASRDSAVPVEELLTPSVRERLMNGEEILIPDVPRDTTLDATLGARREFGAFLAVPLTSGDEVVGILATARREVGAFVDEDRKLFRNLANVVARELAVAGMLRAALSCPVTGLLSRQGALFLLERDAERADRDGKQAVLFMCDVDGLEELNTAHGVDTMNAALKTLGERLVDASRLSEWVAHLGGGTFLALFLAESAEAGDIAARRVLEVATAEPVEQGEAKIAFACSAGAALRGVQQSAIALLSDAMAALLAAKRAAGNQLMIVSAENEAAAAEFDEA